MQRHQDWNYLAASHTTELAEKWGRRVRNLIAEHSPTLGINLAPDSQAAGRWALTSGSEYYSAGVGTGIAGFRAKIGSIDDPIRSRQDADSELIRDRIWDWYINDFRTRLVPGAREILIQTRWHEDDLAGRALNHSKWHVIELPAEAKENDALGREVGEWLWSDDNYGYGAQLSELKKTTPARTWSALYQQSPAPEDGDYWKKDWFIPYRLGEHPPIQTLHIYGASDYGLTEDGDPTMHGIVGVDPQKQPWLLDLWWDQKESPQSVDGFCQLVRKWRPLEWAEDSGQIRAGIGPFREQRMRELKAHVFCRGFPTKHDKAVRAQSARAYISLYGLRVPENAPWYPKFISELLSFPAGKHDESTDMLGLIGQLLDTIQPGLEPLQQKPRAPMDDYIEVDPDHEDDDWKAEI